MLHRSPEHRQVYQPGRCDVGEKESLLALPGHEIRLWTPPLEEGIRTERGKR